MPYRGSTKLSPQESLILTFRAKKGTFFIKSRFLATQEELEALLWICFTSWMTLSIFEEKICFRFFFVEKKSDEKNISEFLVNIFKLYQLENIHKKIEIFFSSDFFSNEKKSKKYFFFKNQKYHPWGKTYPKQSF